MRKIKVLFLFIYIFNNISSQDRLSVSFSASPIISNSILKSSKDTTYFFHQTSGSYINGRKNTDKSIFGFKLGLNVIYNINTKLSCFTGFNYIFQRIMQSEIFEVGQFQYSGFGYYIYGDKYNASYSKYHYLSIPIGINLYLFSIDKFNIGLNSGFSFDYLINSSSIVDITPNNTNYYKDYTFTTEYNFGLNFDYKIQDNLIIFIRPDFNIFIMPNMLEYSKPPATDILQGKI